MEEQWMHCEGSPRGRLLREGQKENRGSREPKRSKKPTLSPSKEGGGGSQHCPHLWRKWVQGGRKNAQIIKPKGGATTKRWKKKKRAIVKTYVRLGMKATTKCRVVGVNRDREVCSFVQSRRGKGINADRYRRLGKAKEGCEKNAAMTATANHNGKGRSQKEGVPGATKSMAGDLTIGATKENQQRRPLPQVSPKGRGSKLGHPEKMSFGPDDSVTWHGELGLLITHGHSLRRGGLDGDAGQGEEGPSTKKIPSKS